VLKDKLEQVKVLLFLLISIFIVSAGKTFSLGLSDTLVNFSNDIITSDEYLNRGDFSYPLKKNNISDDSLKKEFLYSLIAEKLWASECEKMNLDSTNQIQSVLYPVRKFFIVDELFNEEITSKIKITPQDISYGTAKFRENLNLEMLSSADSVEIYHAYNLLSSDKPLKELPEKVSRTKEPVEIIFGQIQDENAENIIYKLNTGYFSKPVFSTGKWFIFKLIERKKKDIIDMSGDAIKMNVEQIIWHRRSSFLENRFRDSLFSHLKIETNGEIFKKLCAIVSEILTDRFNDKNWDTSKAVVLYQSDLDRIFKGVGENNFDKPFILFEKDPLSLRESLLFLPYKPFKIKDPSLSKITNVFKSYFRYVIEQEILYREAVKNKIQFRINVQEKISIWKKSFQADMYSSYVWNSLSKKTPSTPDKTKRLFEETMEKNTASLFAKYNVQINSSLLQDLKISLLNTFTVQYLGFGNELPAFPLIIPYFEWIFRLTKNPLP
jgi:hypothetical protein